MGQHLADFVALEIQRNDSEEIFHIMSDVE